MKTILLGITTLLFGTDIGLVGQFSTTIPALLICGLITTALGLAVVGCGLRNAPQGYEDERGFHFTTPRNRVSKSAGLTILRPHNAS